MTCTCDDEFYITLCKATGTEPKCPEHTEPNSATTGGFALNDDAAIASALGVTTTTNTI